MGEAGSFEQAIALAKSQVEHFSQRKHRLTAGLGPTRFNKTDMPYGEPSPAGQLELAQPARLPPGAYPRPNRCRYFCDAHIIRRSVIEHYLAGNCWCRPVGLASRHGKTICAEIDDG